MNENNEEKIAELAKKLTVTIMPSYKDYHAPAELTTIVFLLSLFIFTIIKS